MNWVDHLDQLFRGWTQSFMIWLGRTFGVRRSQVTKTSAALFFGTNIMSSAPYMIKHPVSTTIGMILTAIFFGFFFYGAMQGLKLLARNEQWGTYTNWMQWRNLRRLIIFIMPITFLMFVGDVMDHDYWRAFNFDDVFFLVMFYSITVNELPPRQPRAKTVRSSAHAGAH